MRAPDGGRSHCPLFLRQGGLEIGRTLFVKRVPHLPKTFYIAQFVGAGNFSQTDNPHYSAVVFFSFIGGFFKCTN